MRLRSGVVAAAFVGLVGAAGPGQTATALVCEPLFRMYDRDVLMFSSPGQTEDMVVSRNVGSSSQRLIEEGCVTRERDLALLDPLARELRGAVAGEGGAAIKRTWLHVGIVPGVVTEVQLRGFFAAIGLRARGIGAPGLGRRIYVGPFETEGGLAAATDAARRAGFVAPYPRRFGT